MILGPLFARVSVLGESRASPPSSRATRHTRLSLATSDYYSLATCYHSLYDTLMYGYSMDSIDSIGSNYSGGSSLALATNYYVGTGFDAVIPRFNKSFTELLDEFKSEMPGLHPVRDESGRVVGYHTDILAAALLCVRMAYEDPKYQTELRPSFDASNVSARSCGALPSAAAGEFALTQPAFASIPSDAGSVRISGVRRLPRSVCAPLRWRLGRGAEGGTGCRGRGGRRRRRRRRRATRRRRRWRSSEQALEPSEEEPEVQ